MSSDYFHKMNEKTQTRFWINNPTYDEMVRALQHGAINCTTNPAYCARLLTSETDYMHSLIDEAILKMNNYDEIAVYVYKMAVKRLMNHFMPLYKDSGGKEGFVTMQDDPRKDEDPAYILKNIIENRNLGPNYMAKIPVIHGAVEAIEFCIKEDIPICATEVFSISQALYICESYINASSKFNKKPVMYITHISGIFDEYLSKIAVQQGIKIAPAVLGQAGIAIARKEYKILKQLGFQMLGGGARGRQHFLELVGGNAHITINWNTAEEIMQMTDYVNNTLDNEIASDVINELESKFADFKRAYDEDRLKLSEFAGYGPVQLFRNAFLKGWYSLLAEIASRKNYLAV